MKRIVSPIYSYFDRLASNNYVKFFNEKNSLMVYLLHGLFLNKSEINLNYVRPMERMTVDLLRKFIEYHLENDYLFISPGEILKGLDSDRKYVLLTFDDGYYNNHLSLNLLQEYKVSAVFFISTRNIEDNQCFWWDVIYRERMKINGNQETIKEELAFLKNKKVHERERYIIDNFGKNALNPVSDIDRPFTPDELKSFAGNPFVFLGNHTVNHPVLTDYSVSEVRSEIALAQDYLLGITGASPDIISYPYGFFSEEVITVSKETGLKLGVTTLPQKNYHPVNLGGNDPFLLKRFSIRGGNIKKQCDSNRSDFHLKEAISNHRNRKVRKSYDGYSD